MILCMALFVWSQKTAHLPPALIRGIISSREIVQLLVAASIHEWCLRKKHR